MKLSEAIAQADELRPNAVLSSLKEQWMWGFEKEVAEMMDEPFEIPTEDDDVDDPYLLLPEPYSNIYHIWLLPYIDFALEEFDRYQADLVMFNTMWADTKSKWNKNHGNKSSTTIKGVFY